MPRRPPPRTPLESFFDRLSEGILDRLEDTLEDHFEEIAETVARTVQQQTAAQSAPRPHSPPQDRSRRARGQRSTQNPPPPPPPRPSPPQARPIHTLYDDLQISRGADPETVKAAFKALASKYHPDNQTTGNADKARRVIAAYEVLGDKEKRKAYDRTLSH